MKKLLSLVLALTLVLALAAPVFAADKADEVKTGLQIKIENAIPGKNYTAYQILKVDTYDADNDAYRYVAADNWAADLTTEAFLGLSAKVNGEETEKTVGDYLKVDDVAKNGDDKTDYFIWIDVANETTTQKEARAQELAQILMANIAKFGDGASQEAPAAAEGATTSTVLFKDLTAGYYLVDSSAGVLCGMDTAQKVGESVVVTIEEKNVLPTVDKDVKEGENWQDNNDANIGDVVEFRAVIMGTHGAEKYVLHDKMDAALTWITKENEADTTNTAVNVVIHDSHKDGKDWTDTPTTLVEGTDYTVQVGAEEAPNTCTFEVVFEKAFLDKYFAKADSTARDIVVTYKARLNDNAVVDTDIPNTATLAYGDNNTTEPSTTNTRTYDFGIQKDGVNTNTNEKTEKIGDAHFTLYKTETETDGVKTYSDRVAFNKQADSVTYRVDTTLTADDTNTDLVTVAGKNLRLEGLDAGTYYLMETKAPAGYNLMDEVITVTIDNTGKVTFTTGTGSTQAADSDVITIENRTGSQLPSTGGIGTTIFYVVGGILMAAAVVLLVAKKKVGAD